MQNEQCGKCWNLKFDRTGEKTHNQNKNSHNFVPLDYCEKCLVLEFDQNGIPTHINKDDKLQINGKKITHKFTSANARKVQKKKRKRIVFRLIGGSLIAIVSIASISNLFL